MIIDIFQYSNMYTLRKNVQWLADECHVKDECGPYVTKHAPGLYIPLTEMPNSPVSRKSGTGLAETSALIFAAQVGKNSTGLDGDLQCL